MIRNIKRVIIILTFLAYIFFNPIFYIISNKDQGKLFKNNFSNEELYNYTLFM